MSDPDLIERVAQASFQGGWHAAHPDVRAYWRGTVAAIIDYYHQAQMLQGLIDGNVEPQFWPAPSAPALHPTQRDLDKMTGQP